MLGRKTYTREELDNARTALDRQLAAYRTLADTVDAATLAEFEPLFFKSMTLAVDRLFVHRIRPVTGKDGNPLNEVELLTESLINHDDVLQGSKVIKYVPEKAVLGLVPGDRIQLTAEQFERLYRAFLDDIERKFVTEDG